MQFVTRLLTDKSDIGNTRQDESALAPLAADEALLQVDEFALTANNLTYAAFGEAMRYWNFFPSGEDDWGMMPVWGFATVLQSNVPEVKVGERYYGYLPMASVLRVKPGRFNERGFYDDVAYRRTLPSPYQHYVHCDSDPAYLPALSDYLMLLRPLFFTSYMLADFLMDQKFFGAEQLIISSASSKTAYGTAFCFKDQPATPALIGLTSPRNMDYLAKLGLYNKACPYNELTHLDPTRRTLYVDFSGDEALRQNIHAHFKGSLVYDCYAGSATNTEFLKDVEQYDPQPQQYFAPVQIKKRNKDWGREELIRRYAIAQEAFLTAVADPQRAWMQLEVGEGLDEAAQVIRKLKDSGGRPQDGYVIRLPR